MWSLLLAGFLLFGEQAQGARASVAVTLHGVWSLPRPGIKPMSSALADGLSTAPPGQPSHWLSLHSVPGNRRAAAETWTAWNPSDRWNLDPPVCVLCSGAQSCPTLRDPVDRSPPGSSVHGNSPGKNSEVGCHALLRGSSQLRDQTQISCIAGGFFTSWPTREANFSGSQLHSMRPALQVSSKSGNPKPASRCKVRDLPRLTSVC